jgi:hypothetical protein
MGCKEICGLLELVGGNEEMGRYRFSWRCMKMLLAAQHVLDRDCVTETLQGIAKRLVYCEDLMLFLVAKKECDVMDCLVKLQEQGVVEKTTLLRVLSETSSLCHKEFLEKITKSEDSKAWFRAACGAGDERTVKALLDFNDISSTCIYDACRNHEVLRLLVPHVMKLKDHHRTIQMALYFSLAFGNIESAKHLVSECGAVVLELFEDHFEFFKYIVDVLCTPQLTPHLAHLGVDYSKECLRDLYKGAEKEQRSLLEFALQRKRWDCVRVMLKLRPELSWTATRYAIEVDEEEELLVFLKRWCNLSDEVVSKREEPHKYEGRRISDQTKFGHYCDIEKTQGTR